MIEKFSMRLRRNILRYSAVLMLFVQSGCLYYAAPKGGRLFLSGQYSELEKYVEEKMARGSHVEIEEFSYLCAAYWKLKKYDKLFGVCGEDWNKRLQKEEPKASWLWDSTYSVLWGRAFTYIELGNYDKAIAVATQSLTEVPARHRDPFHMTYTLSALSLAYALKGDRTNALKYAELLENVGPLSYKYKSLQVEKLIELAKVYMALGEFDKALATMNRTKKEDLAGGWKVAVNLFLGASLTGKSLFTYQELPKAFMLAKNLYETGHVEEAKEGYDWLLRQPGTPINGDIYWMILFDRGRIAEKEGKLKEAIDFYEKAVSVIERQRSTINTEASKIGYIGDKQTVYHHLIAALFSDARHAKAFEYVERSKSRALVDLLASKKEFAVQKGDGGEINAILKKLDVLEAEERIQETDQRFDRVSHKRSLDVDIKNKLKTQAPELASLVTVTAVSTEEIQSRLESGETLVEYYSFGEDLYAFILARGNLRAIRLDGSRLTEEVQTFRSMLEDPGSKDYLKLSEKLFERLIKPMESLLETNHLILVPHGVLHYLPFNALRGAKGYVIDKYSIRYLPSASVMNYLGKRETRTGNKLMAMGNPNLGDRKANLTYAEQEARSIAKAFPESTVLVRKEATETIFKKVASHFNCIHLATHGIFDSNSPLTSGLLLTEDSANDGLLTVEELYSLRLNADLVTLSACETGLSKISNGDDLVGLARGFLYAGTNAIVPSLWSVDDQATSFLMAEFYANLKKTNKRDALREAQLETKKKYEHPFYWAAFQLTGQV